MNSTHLRANNRRRRNHFDNGVTFEYSNDLQKANRFLEYTTACCMNKKPYCTTKESLYNYFTSVGLMVNVSSGVGIGRKVNCGCGTDSVQEEKI
ncbi:hypothetical protein T11_13476 [Trichinella zimbabwensis]|uniref:Uncharacterized protein n=1 Tax=Trichinella zimbabwensis TaxID=268475 RepID=A0A0V1HJ82_9BILA|nr:hypothetical protein T11_234 [Trichinella zimbabwensis]KRZ10803.1 hypothetical protein T11_13476 [Trichinella zimbabwensis]